VEARIVVASIDTYLRYAEAMGITAPIARPPGAIGGREELQPGDEVRVSVGQGTAPIDVEPAPRTRGRSRSSEI
jgi:hypothetical protein